MFNLTTHAISEFPINGVEADSITTGPDGNLWFTGLDQGTTEFIGQFNLTSHDIVEYPAPSGLILNSNGSAITVGPTATFGSSRGAGRIGQFNLTTHTVSEFPLPMGMHQDTLSITAGPDGNLWFTIFGQQEGGTSIGAIGQINPVTHAIAEFPVQDGDVPDSITPGPDGNLWFTTQVSGDIGQINPTTHAIAEFPSGIAGRSVSITTGPDGDLWFTGIDTIGGVGGVVGRIDPTTHVTADFPAPRDANPVLDNRYFITTGSDGNLYVAWSTTFVSGSVVSGDGLIGQLRIGVWMARPSSACAGMASTSSRLAWC